MNETVMKQMLPKGVGGSLAYAVQFFDELYVTFVSILVMLNREKDALVYIETILVICKRFKMDQVQSRINLIKASLLLKVGTSHHSVYSLLVQCEQFFKLSLDIEGRAETFLLKALFEKNEIIQK